MVVKPLKQFSNIQKNMKKQRFSKISFFWCKISKIEFWHFWHFHNFPLFGVTRKGSYMSATQIVRNPYCAQPRFAAGHEASEILIVQKPRVCTTKIVRSNQDTRKNFVAHQQCSQLKLNIRCIHIIPASDHKQLIFCIVDT